MGGMQLNSVLTCTYVPYYIFFFVLRLRSASQIGTMVLKEGLWSFYLKKWVLGH